jgi:hypothetical protein
MEAYSQSTGPGADLCVGTRARFGVLHGYENHRALETLLLLPTLRPQLSDSSIGPSKIRNSFGILLLRRPCSYLARITRAISATRCTMVPRLQIYSPYRLGQHGLMGTT